MPMLGESVNRLRTVFQQWYGDEVDTQGDAFFVAFAAPPSRPAAVTPTGPGLACLARWRGSARPDGAAHRQPSRHRRLRGPGRASGRPHHDRRPRWPGAALPDYPRPGGHDLPTALSLRDLGAHRLKDLELPAPLPARHSWPARRLSAPEDARHLPHNLPLQPTPLVGREEDIAAVEHCCTASRSPADADRARWYGKTRLGLQVAAELSDAFPDGVFLVPLAPRSDPDLVVPTIAQTLGSRRSGPTNA